MSWQPLINAVIAFCIALGGQLLTLWTGIKDFGDVPPAAYGVAIVGAMLVALKDVYSLRSDSPANIRQTNAIVDAAANLHGAPGAQGGHASISFCGFLLMFIALGCFVGVLPGCASIGKNVDQSKLITQIAVMKVIEADKEHATERAARVKEFANEAQTFLDAKDVTVAVLADAVNARLAALDLAPSDRVLANALVGAVVSDLQTRVGGGLLSADQRYTVSQVLGWVEQAASFY